MFLRLNLIPFLKNTLSFELEWNYASLAQYPYLAFKPYDSTTSELEHTEKEMPGKEQVEQLVNSELDVFLSGRRGIFRQKPHFSLV